MDNFYELASKRQSCRNYSDRPVEKEKLMQCIKSAAIAPSACNGQPWHYTLITESETVAKLVRHLQSAGANRFTSKTPAFAVITEKPTNAMASMGERLKDQDFSSMDIGISVAHFVLQAEALGLSTCIIGWFNENGIKELLNIKKSDRIRLVIAVGYKDDSDKLRPKKRKSLEDILTVIE
ncbi:MAG TPA: nitroreductase family protein [Clostridia bacterium]|jgi:nitroreductase|nr:NAD(P)H nitroreductase [Clostridiaceae bacterium]HOF26817.1 nitroreductase family protein [Clostridia bacterium]HOM33882.1 nitroreductase family protein [Clostridia bacterium]HOR89860.1 nitroreductase family protein [Clostridia bacterium]HOT69956.1 nitroreductase family protein [Clostridia bacterium]